MKIYAGFDSGGTSTRCLIADETGRPLGYGKGGPSNYLFCGRELAAASIRQSLREALSQASTRIKVTPPLAGIFIASAAVEVFGGSSHAEFFKEVTGCDRIECDSDIFPVWFAAGKPRFAPAICTIAGTGAVTYLLSGHRFVKSSGWGPLFGDEGSGYDIGQKALQLVSRMSDGRASLITQDEQAFYEAVLEHYQVPLEHPRRLLRAVNRSSAAEGEAADDGLGSDYRSRAASVTRTVDALAQEDNQTAMALFETAAEDIARSVRAVILRSAHEDPYGYTENDSGESFPLVLSGGLFREESPLTRALKKALSGEERLTGICLPSVPAVQSAACIALYQAGLEEAAEKLYASSFSAIG